MTDAIEHSRTPRQRHQRHKRATVWAVAQGEASPEALERLLLEALEHGITLVEWAPVGSIVQPPLDS